MEKKLILAGIVVATLTSCSSLTGSTASTSKYQYLLTAIEKYNDLDTDGNGKLSKSEISGAASSLNLTSLTENFTTIDTNKDCGLSLTELVSYKSLLGL